MKKWTFILLLGSISCNTAQRQLSKTQEYLFKHPDFTAGVCAEQFPDKPDSVIVVTDTVMGAYVVDSLVIDTLLHDTTLFRTMIKTQKIYIKKDSIIYRENRAEQERLQLALFECQKNNGVTLIKNAQLERELNIWKSKAKTRWWWIALLIGGIVGTIAIKIFGKTKLPI